MSAGPRISRVIALDAAWSLSRLWGLGGDCCWCGSLRRECPDVGDLDLVAPLSPGSHDPLYNAIHATLDHGELRFGREDVTVGVAVRGHKPGFLASAYELRLRSPAVTIPLQITRYTPENVGWKVVMATGPAEFCALFLGRWKRAWSIPPGQEASREGHLRNSHGGVVPVPTEGEAFRLAGMGYVEPADRSEHVRRMGLDREQMR